MVNAAEFVVLDSHDQHAATCVVCGNDIAAGQGEAVVTMHPWEEPPLLEVAPGNSVACYLVSPPPHAGPLVEAAP